MTPNPKLFLLRLMAVAYGCMLLCAPVFAQNGQDEKLLKDARVAFDKGEYAEALPLFKRIQDKTIKNDPLFCYQIGLCYNKSELEKEKAIPYLEKAVKHIGDNVPAEAWVYLGELYHYQQKFSKAMECYQSYMSGLPEDADKGKKEFIWKHINTTEAAIDLIADSVAVEVKNLGLVVNSPWAEHSPVISADERILIFTATERQSIMDKFSKEQQDERIYISYRKDSTWSVPSLLQFDGNEKGNFGSVGMYADGQKLMIYKGSRRAGNIYLCVAQADSTWSAPEKINHISSNFWEGSASITPDENTIYFSSNRPGGYGGKDIYKVERLGDDKWSKPINLGPMVNTPEDEDAPFIHPDQKTLYFSSKGHRGMGGYDVFKAKKMHTEWSVPVNLGYPINSTGDDVYFVVSANGRNGYFASNRRSGFGDLDLYSMRMPSESIPLTLIRGVITAGDPAKPVAAKINVIDRETNRKLHYVYNPNPKTGKYLMIFPPGKNYDMVVEAEGYTPHLINIYVPQQKYFYELYQEIHLSDIKSTDDPNRQDTIIGEQLSIRNTFYDVRTHLPDTSTMDVQYSTYNSKDYDPLLDLLEKLINQIDSTGLSSLDEAVDQLVQDSGSIVNVQDMRYSPLLATIDQIFETTDSIALQHVDEIVSRDPVDSKYLYGDKLIPYVIGEDTIYTTPFDADDPERYVEEVRYDGLTRITVFYETGQATISNHYREDLKKLVKVVVSHPDFLIRVEGYTDDVGTPEANQELSRQRSVTVQQFLVNLGIPKERIMVAWHGEIKSSGKAREANRKTVISLVATKPMDRQ